MLRAKVTVPSEPVDREGGQILPGQDVLPLGCGSSCLSLTRRFRLPFTFVTKEVAEATCNCLLAQAEQADKKGKSKAAAERMILEEFGRCLMSVINSAGKAKSDPCAMNC